jgi:hypothetical protein
LFFRCCGTSPYAAFIQSQIQTTFNVCLIPNLTSDSFSQKTTWNTHDDHDDSNRGENRHKRNKNNAYFKNNNNDNNNEQNNNNNNDGDVKNEASLKKKRTTSSNIFTFDQQKALFSNNFYQTDLGDSPNPQTYDLNTSQCVWIIQPKTSYDSISFVLLYAEQDASGATLVC